MQYPGLALMMKPESADPSHLARNSSYLDIVNTLLRLSCFRLDFFRRNSTTQHLIPVASDLRCLVQAGHVTSVIVAISGATLGYSYSGETSEKL